MSAPAAQPRLRVVTDEAVKPPPARRVVIQPVRGMDAYNSRPATGLTADMLVSMYRSAEAGRPLAQFDTFEQLKEGDGHLRGLIEGREESVAGSDWVLKPGRQDKASERAAAMLEEMLRHATTSTTPTLVSGSSSTKVGGFREFVEHHLGAAHFGCAMSNIVWDVVDRMVMPVELVNAAHRRFASPSQERANEIWLVNGITNELQELEAGLWATTRRGRNPWVSGSLRTASWFAMFKRWSFRDLLVFAEMFGIPLALGYYEEGASQASREALEEAVRMIGEDGYAVLSAMTELVIKETARSGDASTVYPVIRGMCDDEMSKLIVGGTLNTDVAGVGSYNAATVHESRAYKKERADARRVEEMFTRCIGVPFCIWNGLDAAAPPRLRIQITRDNLERAKVLETVGQVVELDQDQIREEFSLRTPAPGKGVKFTSKPAGKEPPGA